MSDFATWSTYSYSDLVLGLIQSSDFCTTLTAHSLVTESLEPPEQFVSRGGGTESHDSGFHQGGEQAMYGGIEQGLLEVDEEGFQEEPSRDSGSECVDYDEECYRRIPPDQSTGDHDYSMNCAPEETRCFYNDQTKDVHMITTPDEGYGDSQIATPNDGTVALQARSFILPYVHGSTNAILEGVFAFRSYERVSVGDSIQFSFPVNGQLGQDQGNVLQMMPDDSNFSDASEVPIVFDTGVYKYKEILEENEDTFEDSAYHSFGRVDGGNDIESRNLEAAAAVYSESESEEVVFDVSATCNEDILIQSDGEIPADDTSDVTDLNDSCEYEDLVHDEESRYRLPPIHDHPGQAIVYETNTHSDIIQYEETYVTIQDVIQYEEDDITTDDDINLYEPDYADANDDVTPNEDDVIQKNFVEGDANSYDDDVTGDLVQGQDVANDPLMEASPGSGESKTFLYTSPSNPEMQQRLLVQDGALAEYANDYLKRSHVLERKYLQNMQKFLDLLSREVTPKELEVSDKSREIVVDWLIQVQNYMNFQVESLYTGVALFDLYYHSEQPDVDTIQLVAITCIILATKLHEDTHSDINQLIHLTEDSYTRKQVLRMEEHIMEFFDFNLPNVATPYSFKVFFQHENDFVKKAVSYLVELVLKERFYYRNLPSAIVQACISVTKMIEALPNEQDLEEFQRRPDISLLELQILYASQQASDQRKGAREKYSSLTNFGSVSQMLLLNNDNLSSTSAWNRIRRL